MPPPPQNSRQGNNWAITGKSEHKITLILYELLNHPTICMNWEKKTSHPHKTESGYHFSQKLIGMAFFFVVMNFENYNTHPNQQKIEKNSNHETSRETMFHRNNESRE